MPESAGAGGNLPEDAHGQTPARTENEGRSNAPCKTPEREIGGPKGPEPTRYGDWERNGRCTDF